MGLMAGHLSTTVDTPIIPVMPFNADVEAVPYVGPDLEVATVSNLSLRSIDPQGTTQAQLPTFPYIYITSTILYIIVFVIGVIGE